MARYRYDYEGIRGESREWSGADPNYRGGAYGGMRMRAEPGQAAYGWYRRRHPMEYESSGGFGGDIHNYSRYARDYDRGPMGGRGGAGYDREWGGGGVRDLRYDREALREFNANSAASQPDPQYRGSRYGDDYGSWGGRRRDPHPTGERFDYPNRGLSTGGYAEGWAWGPMRGAR